MSALEFILFKEIFEEALTEELLNKLFEELNDIESISDLEKFIEGCLKHETAKEFRDCVINKIKNAKELKEANAQKLIDEQKKRTLSTPKPSRNH
jgi:hypothetical protein